MRKRERVRFKWCERVEACELFWWKIRKIGRCRQRSNPEIQDAAASIDCDYLPKKKRFAMRLDAEICGTACRIGSLSRFEESLPRCKIEWSTTL
ncbi:hypothetical protein ARD30_17535 [Bosea thiooxidans]|uniref:Uncharacterized protein n=1 Tax=Bosea thiooxidans TaxID=53254 RepID=A0A0Q3PI06_9HYPH|nr:hypothetical protein ARD30_17535 [Bosea thiooxidans]